MSEFKVGQKVWCRKWGYGRIACIMEGEEYIRPINVYFHKTGEIQRFDLSGNNIPTFPEATSRNIIPAFERISNNICLVLYGLVVLGFGIDIAYLTL